MKYFLVFLLFNFVLVLSIASNPKKNILFLLADDGGFEFPFYGNNIAQAPSLAKLAERATIFDNAYTTVSSCASSRASILTGLPTHQVSVIKCIFSNTNGCMYSCASLVPPYSRECFLKDNFRYTMIRNIISDLYCAIFLLLLCKADVDIFDKPTLHRKRNQTLILLSGL